MAIGLVHRPDVLFLDEPTTGLDPEARAEMWAEIGRLAGDDAMTVLLTTHYLDEADRLAHRLAIVDHGRVAVEGTPEELKSELHGDTVAVELADAPADGLARGRRAGRACAGSPRSSRTGRPAGPGRPAGARAVPAVFAALDRRGIAVVSATVSRPSLDDVYLRTSVAPSCRPRPRGGGMMTTPGRALGVPHRPLGDRRWCGSRSSSSSP